MEKEEKLFSSQRGITLIALIITIIVLLILAGITISLVVGDNGVLTQAKKASIETSKADLEEALGRAVASAEGEYATSPEFNNGSETFYEWLKGDSGRLKENGYTITLKNKSDGLQGTITKEDKNNGLKFTLKGGETTLDVDVDITGEYNKGEGKTAADLGPEDIGKVVKYEGYEADYDGDWEIFYTDEEHIYLITKSYLYDNACYGIWSSDGYNGTEDFKIEERLNNFPAIKAGWLSNIYSDGEVKGYFYEDNYNIKYVEYLLDAGSWKKFEVDDIVEYAIGTPTLELLVASYDFYHGGSTAGDLLKNSELVSSRYFYPDVFVGDMRLPENTVWNHGFSYCLASPYKSGDKTEDFICAISEDGKQSRSSYRKYPSAKQRPVVVLSSSVELRLKDGFFEIVE